MSERCQNFVVTGAIGRIVSVALATCVMTACYSAPSVSDPPVLEQVEVELASGSGQSSPLTGNDLEPTDGTYAFTLNVKGRPGKFDNGDSEAEQWVFRQIEGTLTLGGAPLTVEWVVQDDVASPKSFFSLPETEAGKTLEFKGRVFDALGRPSNELARSVKLVAAPSPPPTP